ncbi:hypothetical protein CFII64_27403 [Pseudomonas sp. CFII64]|uniref:hypothetical protein n=1 Tax=Pseudomonas sp. CFII64 TaxID=911242 RepID=UPI000356FD73|nr:hypothetical protein [Pseudomonas sp. CFII64]EPJ76906.1 hypothetical protein CFII64_27403 [Pseudomonas sp. CFII64]
MPTADDQTPQPDELQALSDEIVLLGLAMLGAQMFEFTFYGRASHLKATFEE